MDIEINREKKTVELSMIDQIKEAINMIDKELKEGITCPAYRDLFESYKGKSPELDKNRKETFHSIVVKLLLITKRMRPVIKTAISYLTTRVAKSNERDWFKMKRVLSFLKGTINDRRIIGASSLHDLYTWINAAYTVHDNMRGHTGGVMSFGTGIIHAKSSKQKINVKSMTESELVGASEYCPYNIWQMMFMEHQGYPLYKNILFQDNQSTIKMHKNRRNLCTRNSRHIHIRYFL